MYARLITLTDVDDIDTGLRFLSDKALPIERAQPGYQGFTASTDQEGLLDVLSLWDTETDRDASETVLAPTREEARRLISAQLTVENFERTTEEIVRPPAVGMSLMVAPISMDPADVDYNVAHFQSEVVPHTRLAAGFCGLNEWLNRRTGRGLVISAWQDEQSMRAYWDRCIVPQAGRPIRLGEPGFREIVFVDPN